MTATPSRGPSPWTIYGDLDVSLMNEIPGEDAVETKVFMNRPGKGLRIIRGGGEEGRQAFVGLSLVDESEKLDLKDATQMAEHLQRDVFLNFESVCSWPDEERREREDHGEFKEGACRFWLRQRSSRWGLTFPMRR